MVVKEFNKLQQDDNRDACLERLENLKALVIRGNPLLPFDYFLDSLIKGLKSHIKSFTKGFPPTKFGMDMPGRKGSQFQPC